MSVFQPTFPKPVENHPGVRAFIPASRWVRFVLLLLFLAFLPRPASAATLALSVVDLLTQRPIPNATATLRQRLITTDPSGEQHLHPLHTAPILQTSSTPADGRLTFVIPAAETTHFLSLEISAPGYEPQIESLIPVTRGANPFRTLLLIPQRLTPAQSDQIIQFHKDLRAQEPIDQGPYIENRADLRPLATAVPDEVRVQNLNGFTGQMNFDEFIGGVVTREMNDGFPREALRAQAVASRSYALHRLQTLGYANGGQAYTSTLGSLSRAAALYTSKQVLLYKGAVAQAFFSARCHGDATLNSEDGPTLDRCYRGGLTTAVVPYCRARPCSGHINCSATSEPCCTVTIKNKINYIYGHGVGLCQRGAQQFASRDSLPYTTILHNYYTGVTLHTGSTIALPTVETTGFDILSASSVRIQGRVANNGGSTIDDRRFDWGTDRAALDRAIFSPAITVTGNDFTATLADLQLGTTYFYRAWAQNSSPQNAGSGVGWSTGNILSFALTQVATPAIDPPGGTFTNEVQITLTSASNGAEIYYTTNGAVPGLNSTRYTAPFPLTQSATLQARASKPGFVDSPIATATYTILKHNPLHLRLLAQPGDPAGELLLEIRSTLPNTTFDLQSTTTLNLPTWTTTPAQQNLTTGPQALLQIHLPINPNAQYLRALAR